MIYPKNFEHKIGFDSVRQRLNELCVSSDAKTYVNEMSFLTSFDDIMKLLEQTSEMVTIINMSDGFRITQLGKIYETIPQLKIAGGFLQGNELIELQRLLVATNETVTYFAIKNTDTSATPFPELSELSSELTPLPECLRAIDRVIDRYGNVKDTASPELGRIRGELSSTSGRINSIMRRVISRAASDGYLDADINPTVREGRLVIPVQPMHKRHIPGIVHDESASGKTYFIEPAEIVEANNRVRELQMEERREIIRILVNLSDDLRPNLDIFLLNAEILNRIDFIHAKALYAIEIDANLPHVSRKTELEWYHATHPGLLLSLRKQNKEMVPLDITLTQKDRILIISGPNAGGKSVCLKTVGIVQYMLQTGMLPPVYENSHCGIFNDIFIDIGDDQSIEDDLSTYSSHLRNMKHFLTRGKADSLILIDEFGGGTEPQIGGAIAQAILKEFNDKKMWGVITTHYQNLKHFAEDTDGLVNGSMLYDRHLMRPLFRLTIGNPGSSFALEIARKTGLPKSVIDSAEEIVGSDYINIDNYLLDITRDKRYWENKRSEIRRKEKRLDEIIERYENEASTLSEKRKEIIADARKEAKQILEKSNASIERTIHDIRKAQASKEATLEARRRLLSDKENLSDDTQIEEHPLLKKIPKRKNKQPKPKPDQKTEREFSVGDTVKLDGNGSAGKIIEIKGKNAVVNFGMIRTTVSIDRLHHTLAKIPQAGKTTFLGSSTFDSSRQRQLNFKPEIDVRGMRADEAIQATTYFIDDAIQFGVSRVRILHGTGTGALRQALRDYLSSVNGVVSYHDEDVRLGGAGITIVNLR